MISKTDYITYLKHPAWLWLRKNQPDFLDAPDENSQAIIDEGREFEKLAEQIFPEAIHLDRSNYADMKEWADETRVLLDRGVGTILQAAFLYDDFLCIADAITRDGDAYTLTEIKATTSPGKEHVCDLAFQKAVIEWSGYPVKTAQVLHANKDYLRLGNIKLEDIVMFTDVTDKVNKEMLHTTEQMREAAKTAELQEMPSDSLRYAGLGASSEYREIYRALHPNIPEYSIYDLASNKGRGTDKLIGELEDGGVEYIVDIPDSIASARLILGQKNSTIDFQDIMDSGKILICNFSKGLLGEDVSELFGIAVLAKLQLASLRRARQRQSERRRFYLYVDEFQNFATPSFVQLLSEARKYRLLLTIAEQSTSQQDDQQMVNIIMANVGTIICFRTGNPQDERMLLPLFSPFIEQGEISNLPAFNFYAKLSAIHAQEPLSGRTLLLDSEGSDDVMKEVIEHSRNVFATRQETPKEGLSESKNVATVSLYKQKTTKRQSKRIIKTKTQPTVHTKTTQSTSRPPGF